MPKKTVKYTKALEIAKKLHINQTEKQEILYRSLNESGYFWDSDTKAWQEIFEEAHPPRELVRVRVWTDSTKVKGAAYQIKTVMEESGYKLIEQSEPYICRPPKQHDSRIYLSFLLRD